MPRPDQALAAEKADAGSARANKICVRIPDDAEASLQAGYEQPTDQLYDQVFQRIPADRVGNAQVHRVAIACIGARGAPGHFLGHLAPELAAARTQEHSQQLRPQAQANCPL